MSGTNNTNQCIHNLQGYQVEQSSKVALHHTCLYSRCCNLVTNLNSFTCKFKIENMNLVVLQYFCVVLVEAFLKLIVQMQSNILTNSIMKRIMTMQFLTF
jgi:hypothetical protein